jgi:ribosomal protein S18 acetylase RimI-like enzyme
MIIESRLDPGFLVRNFSLDTDVPALSHLLSELGTSAMSEDALRAELAWPNQEPEHDRWVVERIGAPGLLLGHSVGFHTVPERYLVWGEVHPGWRRRGLGSALLARSVQRGRELGVEHILINADSDDEGANLFLRHNGFSRKGDAWLMSAPPDIPLAEPIWPPGYSARTFAEVQDYQTLKDAYFGSCGDLWGHGANSRKLASTIQPIAEDWGSWFPQNDPNGEGIFLAFAPDGAVAGLCRGVLSAKVALPEGGYEQPAGLVDALGVMPAHRARPLQRPLALAVMHWLRAGGQDRILLEAFGIDETSANTYQGIGFTLDQHLIAYHMDLSQGS